MLCARAAISSSRGHSEFALLSLSFFFFFPSCLFDNLALLLDLRIYWNKCFPGSYDPELRVVLELATDSELYELENILFGPRLFAFSLSIGGYHISCWS